MQWELFFLEAQCLITVPWFVYSWVFTYQLACSVPRLIHTLLLLQQPWHWALDLMTCYRQTQSYEMYEICHQEHKPFWFWDSFFIENLREFCFLSQMKGFISCFSSYDRTSGFCKQRWGSEWWGWGLFLGSHCSLRSAWVLESERACSHHSLQHASSESRASYLPSVRLHLLI